MKALLSPFLFMVRSCFRTRASLQIEILALRHQLAVLQRRTNTRATLRTTDRLLWVILSRVWAQWRTALVIVKPETVIGWHRKGFRWHWSWKSMREVELVSTMARPFPAPDASVSVRRGTVIELPQVGGLHHRYERRAA